MPALSQRTALGVLFLFLAAVFAAVAYGSFRADVGAGGWVIGSAAAVLAMWLASLGLRALRPRQ